jgi:hypothetical protein
MVESRPFALEEFRPLRFHIGIGLISAARWLPTR